MKKTIRLMGLCLLVAVCIMIAACGKAEENNSVLLTHFGNGDLESLQYVVHTMSAKGTEGNTITVEADGYTYVHTYDTDTFKVIETVCTKGEEAVYTASFEGDKATVVYKNGKTLNVTFSDEGIAFLTDGTTSISYEYTTTGRIDEVTRDGVTVKNTVNKSYQITKTVSDEYEIAYVYNGSTRTETMTIKASNTTIVTVYENNVKKTVTVGDIVATYDAEGNLVSREQNGVDLIQKDFTIENGKIVSYSGSATALEIPAIVNSMKVTSIGSGIFAGNENAANITSITIPTGVNKIEAGAFDGASLVAKDGVIYAGKWVIGVDADEITLDKDIVGIADEAIPADVTVNYSGCMEDWLKVVKGAVTYTLNLQRGVDGYLTANEYSWTTDEIMLKEKYGAQVTENTERLLYIVKPFESGNDGAVSFKLGVHHDSDYVYLALWHRDSYKTDATISLNTPGGQIDLGITAARGSNTHNVTVTKYTSADDAGSDVKASCYVDSAYTWFDNGFENVNVIEIKLDRNALGVTDTLGYMVHLYKQTENGICEAIYGDEYGTMPVKSFIKNEGDHAIGYHVISLRDDESRLSLECGWLLADYGYKQKTFDLGAQLERTSAPVVDGVIGNKEYTWSNNLTKDAENFFYIDENLVAEGDKDLDIKLAYDKNYIYVAVTAAGVHDKDSIAFRLGNTEATGKAWYVTVTRDESSAKYQAELAEGNPHYNTIKVITTEQKIGDKRNYQEASGEYNSSKIVVGRAMEVGSGYIALEIAFDRGALERDANNPDLDRLYLHVLRSMATKDGESLGEIHFGFRVEEGAHGFNEDENFAYDNAIHRYHRSIFNRYPHVITFKAPDAPAEAVSVNNFQIGYGIANITPWIDEMGLSKTLLNSFDRDATRTIKFDDGSTKYVDSTNDDGSLSVQLAGYINADTRYSTEVATDLFATCIAFRDKDGDMAMLISLDILHLTIDESACLYDNIMRLLRPLGFEEGDVIISATHTHTAPNVFGADITMKFGYMPYFYEQIFNAAQMAVNDLNDVSAISTNYHTTTEQMSFERRGFFSEGDFWGNSIKPDNGYNGGKFESDYVFNGERLGRGNGLTADSDIQMVRIERAGKKPIVIANWSAHPDNVPKDDTNASVYRQPVSGDYIYYMRDAVDETCDFIFFQGASGNTIIASRLTKTEFEKYSRKPQAYGEDLADELLLGLNNMVARSTTDLSIVTNANEFNVYYDSSHVGIPAGVSLYIDLINSFYDGKINMTEANELIAEYNEKTGMQVANVYECASLRARYGASRTAANRFDFVAITIGDVTFISAPYEMFWQTAWDIRNDESISDKTILVLTHANGTYGYIPTQEIIESREGYLGGYEVIVCNYEKGSAERIAEHMIEMIEQNYAAIK